MTARGIHTCCPEAPSTINVINNVIQMGGQQSFFINEVYTGSDVIGGVLTLRHTPYQAAAVQVILNSGTQIPTQNYQVVGNQVVFKNFVPAAADVIHIRSFQAADNVSVLEGSDMPTGTMVGYGGVGGSPPSGWLFMDGITQVTSAFSALHTFLGSNLSLTLEGTTSVVYTLKDLSSPFYDGQTFVAGRTLIKI